MINGITVLSQEAIIESSVGWTLTSAVGAFVLAWIIFAIALRDVAGDTDLIINLIAIASIGAAFIAGFVAYRVTSEDTGRYRYECLIDESVSAVELNERYVIKEKRGEIYVIEDREGEDEKN